ncbi:reverse transcriptase domain-containing protein [Tanacetum coccineum]
MSTHEQQITNNPTSTVRNIGGRNGPQGLEEPMSDEVLREMLKKNRSPSPRLRPRKEGGVFNRLGRKEPTTSARFDSRQRSPQAKRTEVEAKRRQQKGTPSRTTSQYSESEDSEGGHWKSKSRRQRSDTYEDDLSQPWTCEERNPFTPRIRHFSLPRTRMPSHVKTYDGSGDPEDHLKLFQSAAKTEGWAMPTWCHMFNSTLTGNARVWFDKLPKESIDSYEDLRTAFRENYLQQTKHIKDPVEIHHIKQRDGESTEDFMERYKAEVLDVEGAPECMRISGFMYGITHPRLIKRLYERIPRSMDEMYRMTTSFLQGEVAALSHGQRKASSSWKPSEGGNKPNFKKGFKNKHRPDRKPDRFSLLTKTAKEIFALEKGKFKAPPPMVTPVEKRDPNKYCEFHSDMGHSTNECMQLRKQIDEMIKAEKLSQFIKELKQNDKPKAPEKGEATGKDKPLTILMIQPWERVAKPMITQSFSPETEISFPPLKEEDRTEDPMIIEVEIGRLFVHRVYIDGGASSEVFYEHCFIKLRKEIRDQIVPATTHLIGFSGETIWPLGQIALLVKIDDEMHSTSAWMNFMIIRSPSQHNAIIGRPGIRKIRAVLSTAHGMLKFPVEGGTVMLQSSRVIPMECAMISGPSIQSTVENQVLEEKINIAIHPEYPEQTVAIGSTLTEKGSKELCSLLKQNLDIFSWKPADTTGVPRNIAEHRLNIWEGYSPVRQKKRGQALERNKHNGTWRMCVDFKDLNNACPKDCYPLPEIDWKVESFCGYSFKCFLDAYKGYHQIKMAKEDEEKTTFITSQGIFCYFKMPFGLKNVRSTYQRLVDKAFQKQIGHKHEIEPKEMRLRNAGRNVLSKRSYQRGLDDGQRRQANTSIFCKPTLQGPEVNYTPMEKLVLALLGASKRLKRYFQAHTVVVITNQPINQLLSSSEISGRILKWKFELEGYDIQYRLRTAIKGQILVDFIMERPEEESPDELMAEPEVLPEPWTLFTNGSSCVMAPGQVLVEELKEKSINEKEILDIVEEEGSTWMTPICEYLTKEILLEDKKKARAVRQKAARFGLPGEIISDNGKQFCDNPFKDWCEKLCIRQCFTSVKHPQANGLVERANRGLGEGIKARLDEKSKDWIEELPHVLWAYRTMIKSSNGETPFSLTYGTEAVIPAEIGMPTLWTAEINQTKNNEALGINLDLIEERRELSAIQEAKSKKKMEKYYNSRVRGTSFKPGEMVYRSNEASHAKDEGKLEPKWEGPYEVKESLRKGAYKLKDCKGNEMPRTWNICNLKKCYIHEL